MFYDRGDGVREQAALSLAIAGFLNVVSDPNVVPMRMLLRKISRHLAPSRHAPHRCRSNQAARFTLSCVQMNRPASYAFLIRSANSAVIGLEKRKSHDGTLGVDLDRIFRMVARNNRRRAIQDKKRSIISGATGRPSRNPCISSHCSSRRMFNCSLVSTPSATTFRPRE
jgi:hypothetical protein